MFTYLEETHVFWFRGDMDVPDVDFALVGNLLGLAIYNSVILDVQFPPGKIRHISAGTFYRLCSLSS
jgi:hypothetical protein